MVGKSTSRKLTRRCFTQLLQKAHRLDVRAGGSEDSQRGMLVECEDVSQLCHNSRYFNPVHLIVEIHQANKMRKRCKQSRFICSNFFWVFAALLHLLRSIPTSTSWKLPGCRSSSARRTGPAPRHRRHCETRLGPLIQAWSILGNIVPSTAAASPAITAAGIDPLLLAMLLSSSLFDVGPVALIPFAPTLSTSTLFDYNLRSCSIAACTLPS